MVRTGTGGGRPPFSEAPFRLHQLLGQVGHVVRRRGARPELPVDVNAGVEKLRPDTLKRREARIKCYEMVFYVPLSRDGAGFSPLRTRPVDGLHSDGVRVGEVLCGEESC